MDASQSALDSLRTVEFRETLKGYHRDDVDEYLEKAAVEAEGLQEQLRQSGERLRQAAERISQLETVVDQKVSAPQPSEPVVGDDSLQRTLLLAQKFVDETKADAEAQAAKLLADADAKSRMLTEQAQAHASQIANESEQRLREEIHRLEESRNRLSHEVESMSRHLEAERNRLRTALGDILRWVDQNVHPASPQDAPVDRSTRRGRRADADSRTGHGVAGWQPTRCRADTSGAGASQWRLGRDHPDAADGFERATAALAPTTAPAGRSPPGPRGPLPSRGRGADRPGASPPGHDPVGHRRGTGMVRGTNRPDPDCRDVPGTVSSPARRWSAAVTPAASGRLSPPAEGGP